MHAVLIYFCNFIFVCLYGFFSCENWLSEGVVEMEKLENYFAERLLVQIFLNFKYFWFQILRKTKNTLIEKKKKKTLVEVNSLDVSTQP